MAKAMFARGGYVDQDVQAYFTRPTRTVNHRAFGEIRNENKHKRVTAASENELSAFLESWPNIDPDTGLNIRGDELLIKAREAMIAAVHTFNSAGLYFRAELFIVTSIIAWTYLMHAWFKREGIKYQYKDQKYWELAKCIKHDKCPMSKGAINNLTFLLELRHEIEHRSTNRIDDAVGGEMQACCINFNAAMKSFFGPQYALEKRLPIALQFVSFGADQRELLKSGSDLPDHISNFIGKYEHGLTEEQITDPAFRMRTAFVPIAGNRAAAADMAVEFIKSDSKDAEQVGQILIKEVNKKRYTASEIINAIKGMGYKNFSQYNHTQLWKSLDARKEGTKYGRKGDYKNSWVWYESWLTRVNEHCMENKERYGAG